MIVLLLTPSFARCLDPKSSFQSKVLSHVFQPMADASMDDLRCEILGAVVDKLPLLTEPAVVSPDKGGEGLSILIAKDSAHTAPTLWDNQAAGTAFDSMDMLQRDCISFHLDSKSHGTDIELPLCNTIFVNGFKTTMLASTWTKDSRSQHWVQQRQESRFTQNIFLPIPTPLHTDPDQAPGTHLIVPIVPLTEPRSISEGLGNIITKIGGGVEDDVAPASRELEAAVTAFFEAQGGTAEPSTVWALVIPKESVSVDDHYRLSFRHREQAFAMAGPAADRLAIPGFDDAHIGSLIRRGARLHRVLSGGGGWGQKQGLLSLDPESRYGLSDRVSCTTGLCHEDDVRAEQNEALGGVARPGDFVQFFIPPLTCSKSGPLGVSTMETSVASRGATGSGPAKTHLWSLAFGTVPSTIDSMPQVSTEARKEPDDKDVRVLDNHFGALSEQGMSISTSWQDTQSGDPVKQQEKRSKVVTKVDVPYSQLVALYRLSETSS